KVFVDLACSSHNAIWEKNHLILFQASLEWFQQGTVNGMKTGMLKLGYDKDQVNAPVDCRAACAGGDGRHNHMVGAAFPSAVYSGEAEQAVEILAVLHLRRDPRIWRHRA